MRIMSELMFIDISLHSEGIAEVSIYYPEGTPQVTLRNSGSVPLALTFCCLSVK